MLLLLSCWIITGIVAKDPSVTHYRLKNSSACLHVRKPPPYEAGKWTFAGKIIASLTTVNPSYGEKVVYSPGNLSLCIKKLTDTDAGVYEVSFHDAVFNSQSETHQVIVQDRVPRPVMSVMSVPRSNLSAGSCSVAVNCSVQDDWARAVCDEGGGCRTSQTSLSSVNITIFTHNATVVCRGNNHVSANNVSESMETCFRKSSPDYKEEPQDPLKVLIVIAVCAFLCVCAVFLAKRLFHHQQTQTSTAQLIQSQPVETQSQSEPRASSTSSSSRAEPSYENVVQPSQTSSPREDRASKESHAVDTVYSVPHLKASVRKSSSSAAHGGAHEALTPESVTLDETQHPRDTDTVYSLLRMPKKSEVTAPPTGRTRSSEGSPSL